MLQLTTINPELVPDEVAASFRTRTAARAVILDEEGRIAMLSVTKDGYHKLPGGGVEAGEDLQVALARECLEEVGCAIEVLAEIGSVHEIRGKHSFKQDSFAYLAKLVGTKGEPDFTESEAARGFQVE